MTVRRATRKDLRGILKLSKEWTDDGDAMDADVIADYLSGEVVYCIEDEGDVFGILLLNQNANDYHIGRLFVHPDHAGLGYGTALMDAFTEMLNTEHTKAFVYVSTNGNLSDYFARFGFIETDKPKPPQTHQITMMRPAPEPSV